MRISFLTSFLLTSIAISNFVDAYICTLKPITSSGTLRYSLPKKERCRCLGVVAARNVGLPGCKQHDATVDEDDLMFIDNHFLLTNRNNWTPAKLDQLLDRNSCYEDECRSNPCQNGGRCYDRLDYYMCVCERGFNGTNCENDVEVPVFTFCPEGQNFETLSNKSYNIAVWSAPLVSDNSPNPFISCTRLSGNRFGIGVTDVVCVALDKGGNEGKCIFPIDVKDVEDPEILHCPSDQTKETPPGSPTAIAVWEVRARDNSAVPPNITCSSPSGFPFEIGVTNVVCNIVDPSGNAVVCKFKIEVNDLESPVISSCPTNQTLEAQPAQSTAVAVWEPPVFTENSRIDPTVTCTFESGSDFTLGRIEVICSILDFSGNKAQCVFDVGVIGNFCPSNQSVSTEPKQETAVVSWDYPVATDKLKYIPTVTCNFNPGSEFNIGTTEVICNAADDIGNKASCSFSVSVLDTEAPVILLCTNQTHQTSAGENYVEVTLEEFQAIDNSGTNPTVTCDVDLTKNYLLGKHVVTCTTSDPSGNVALCVFNIDVIDREPPTFDLCPESQSYIAEPAQPSKPIVWEDPKASDNGWVAPKTVSCNLESGSEFNIGITEVACPAIDDSGNNATCSFAIDFSGRWGQWTNWGECSYGGICPGRRQRTRTCPVSYCRGDDTDVEECNQDKCPEWKQWGEWENCKLTDNICPHKRHRARECDDIHLTNVPCNGAASGVDESACTHLDCSFWSEWGPYGQCSKTCNEGTEQRTRTCIDDAGGECPGADTDSRTCNKGQCAYWGTWGAYGSCSKTCGSGTKTRTRPCVTGLGQCPGSEQGSTDCTHGACATWGSWGGFSGCSADCGGGRQTRYRSCIYGLGQCVGSRSNSQSCNTQACKECFAADSNVRVQLDRNSVKSKVISKLLSELRVGEFVESYDSDTKSIIYSEVYFITHQESSTNSSLVKLIYDFDNGKQSSIRLHAKHLIYVCKKNLAGNLNDNTCDQPPLNPVTANSVSIGDILWIRNAKDGFSPTTVLKVSEVSSSVRHPMTLTHYIVVDDILASVHMYDETLYRKVTGIIRFLYGVDPDITESWFVKTVVNMWDLVENYML